VPSSNVEVARRGYKAAVEGDLETLTKFLDPEVQWHGGDPNADGACRNRDQALAVMARAHQQGPIGELVDVIEAGAQVVVVMRPRGAGGALRANLTTFRDGRAVEMVAFDSPEAALAAAHRAPRA